MHRFSRWKVPLSEATTVREVHALVDDYLTTLKAADIERLPASCWDALTADDIAGSAVVLIREELHYNADAETSKMLHEIAHTYVAASTRIASIQSARQPLMTEA